MNFDLNTDTGVPSHATLNIAALQGAITQKVTSSKERGLVLTTLTQNRNASANDVPALAAILAARQSARTVAEVEEAIGSLLAGPHISQWTQVEATQNDALLDAAQTVKSRAKGVPNTIPLATLDKVTKADFAGLIAKVKILQTTTKRRLPAEARELQEEYWLQHLSGEMDVRSCHTNGAGWLPVGSTQPRYDVLDNQINQAITTNVLARRRLQGTQPFRFSFINSLSQTDRRDFVWTAHCRGYHHSPYVEFSVSGYKDLRLVYDCLTGRYYATVHYKWQRGYNPFFHIPDA